MSQQNNQIAEEKAFYEGKAFYIELPSEPQYVGRARRAVADFLQEHSWGADEADALVLAVGEACNNAVNYGGGALTAPLFAVSCLPLAGERLQVEVRNQGNGFHPDLNEFGQMPPGEFATHGRGFGLMLALVDDVQVLSDGENTIVRLTKCRKA